MTEWAYRGTVFAEDAELPDLEGKPSGRRPQDLMEVWLPWISECIDLMDSDGAFRHFPLPGGRREQPAYDMEVLRCIRAKWVQLQNEKNRIPVGGSRRGKGPS